MKGVEADYFTERKLFNNKINNETLISFKKWRNYYWWKNWDKLNLKIGDRINIISPDNMETILGTIPRAADFKIIGFLTLECMNMIQA